MEVLGVELPWLDKVEAAKTSRPLPVVLTPGEVDALLSNMEGTGGLIARLLYGTSMRVMEGLRLRVKDVDFARGEILVRDGKGAKDRVTMLPASLVPAMGERLGGFGLCTARILRSAAVRCICPTRWIANIRRPAAIGCGNTCSRRLLCPLIHVRVQFVVITSWTSRFNGRCGRRCVVLGSSSRLRRIRCVTSSLPIYWNLVTTSVPCRNCSAIRMCPRR